MASPPPPDLWEVAWKQLSRAVHDKRHPFRTPAFCTTALDGSPHARTLVLRRVLGQSELWCYTDKRSEKVKEIAKCKRVQWLFWNPGSQMQVALHGQAQLLDAAQAAAIFQQFPKHSRKTYATVAAPATPLAEAGDGLPIDWETAELQKTDYAKENFCVIVSTILQADILSLGRAGHRRLSAQREAGGPWQWQWIVP